MPFPAVPAMTIVAADKGNGCWDCAYHPEPIRQFRPGDMTFTFRPVGGTLNYHF